MRESAAAVFPLFHGDFRAYRVMDAFTILPAAVFIAIAGSIRHYIPPPKPAYTNSIKPKARRRARHGVII